MDAEGSPISWGEVFGDLSAADKCLRRREQGDSLRPKLVVVRLELPNAYLDLNWDRVKGIGGVASLRS